MMLDYTIPKPRQTQGYPLHRMIAALADGSPVLFADRGDHLLVRSAKHITPQGQALAQPQTGAVIAFELQASVAARKGGKNIYPDLHDWRIRRAWLEAQGLKHGFEVMAVHVTGERMRVTDHSGRAFSIDASHFTGVLKVTDAALLSQALVTGIGRVGKAFGMGLLIL
jgi:CRISPR-associated protein Cas6/Cse3/CasE subtype I-E